MNGIAILRIPTVSSERDASSKAINNLITITSDLLESVIVFEEQFDNTEAHVQNIQRKISSNILLNILFMMVYQIRIVYYLNRNRHKLDVIFLHSGGFLFILPMMYCKLVGIKVLVSVIGEPHKGYENVSSGSMRDRIATQAVLYAEKFAYGIADGLAVFSNDMLTYNPISSYQSKCKRVRFNYEPVPDNVPEIDARTNSIVYLGRICELKGADRTFKACKTVSAKMERDITATFVGDGELFDQLRQCREKKKLDCIEFTGWIGPDLVTEVLQDSKILLLPSRSEGLPKALLEAMAQGVVPVVTPVGNMPSVVENRKNGVLLEDPSPISIAETLNKLLNSDRLPEMSENARETITQEYSFETAKSDFEELLKMCEE